MKKNESSQTGRHSQAHTDVHKVHLSCHAREAKAVFVAGTFNDWKPDAAPLHHHEPHGEWTVTLPLPLGRYEYRFVVDGEWVSDPAAAEHVSNFCGSYNSVLNVPAKPAA